MDYKDKDHNTGTKRKITVRRVDVSPAPSLSQERSIPITPDDSRFNVWIAESTELPSENEIQIIDLDDEEPEAFVLLFPELQSEGLKFEELNRTVSTSALTKMLVGKHADFSMLKPSKKLAFPCVNAKLSPIVEEETDTEDEPRRTVGNGAIPKDRPRLNSSEADDEYDD